MLFKIVEKFGPESEGGWKDYLNWRQVRLESFDSVDNMMRPDMFEPDSRRDWDNCVNEDYKLNLITNIDYAREVYLRTPGSEIVGVEIELNENYQSSLGLVGFDIIDIYCSVSLLTNWRGEDLEFIDKYLQCNGLVGSLESALELQKIFRSEYLEDSHANSCEVWAIYRVDY